MEEETHVLYVEDVHRESLLVESLHDNRTQLDLIVEPGVAPARLVQANQFMVGDEAEPEADSLRLQARSIFDHLHLCRVLFFIEHEDKHARLMLQL